MSVTYCGSVLDLGSQVRKFFEGLGWFSEAFFEKNLSREKNQMYTIQFTDGKEENWSAHDVTVNS